MNNKIYEHAQNIRKIHILHQESHGKLEINMNSKMRLSNNGENPKRHLSGRLTLVTVFIRSIMILNYILRKYTEG